jgi:hypothetical protein
MINDRHADLDRGEEGVRIAGELRDPLTAAPAGGDRGELALAECHESHLGRGEDAADQHEDDDECDVPEQIGHRSFS